MATPRTFIFIGRSGCGKGTQAERLIERLKEDGTISDTNPLFYLETGNQFRALIAGTSHTSRLAKAVGGRGERQPDFLAIYVWSHLLVENILGDENIILDGTPRSLPEAQVLNTAMKFFERGKVDVVWLDVSREWSKERMEARGRADDKKSGDIEKRLAWFDADVMPAIKYYRDNPDYNLHRINGEQPIDKVYEDLLASLNGLPC